MATATLGSIGISSNNQIAAQNASTRLRRSNRLMSANLGTGDQMNSANGANATKLTISNQAQQLSNQAVDSNSMGKKAGSSGATGAAVMQTAYGKVSQDVFNEVSKQLSEIWSGIEAVSRDSTDSSRATLQQEFSAARDKLTNFIQSVDTRGQESYVAKVKDVLSNTLNQADVSTSKGSDSVLSGLTFGGAGLLVRGKVVTPNDTAPAAGLNLRGISLDAGSASALSNNLSRDIVSQADTAMLAQANAAPQQVLGLLQ